MKPALVLGLALAANAMVADQGDNELIIASHGRFDRDIAQRFPGKVMFDEVADDELGIKYIHLPVPELVAYDDDELAVRNPTPEQYQRLQNTRLQYKSAEEADDQLWDEAADDELAMKYVHLPVAEHVAYDDDELAIRQQVVYGLPESIAADDELAIKYVHLPHVPVPETVAYDDDELWDEAADDELAIKYVHLPVAPAPEIAAYDDDELVVALPPRSAYRTEEEYQRSRAWYRTHPSFDDAADDELAIRQQVVYGLPTESVAADDADDELAYLGDLIRDRGYIPRLYADDELRVEKPKSQEKTQKPRKLRPHPDVIPMTEN